MTTNKQPLISIILPTYNRAELLPRAINSVISQTFVEWELIIWDDGSTDDTAALVKTYNDNRIRYFFDENHGAAYARNRAIEQAHSILLAFLDSDDEWLPDKLTVQLIVLQNRPDVEVLFSDFHNINQATGIKEHTFDKYRPIMRHMEVSHSENGLHIIRKGLPECLAAGNIIATDTVIMRREVFERVGPFCEELRNSEDYELWWRMSLEGIRFAYVESVLLNRYKPLESLSGQSCLMYINHLKALEKCLTAARNHNRSDLIPLFNHQFSNTWMNLIPIHAQAGEYRFMLHAFQQSLRYNFTPGAVRLLLQSMFSSLLHHERK